MLFNASPTPYDLRFRLLGVPVRVHPVFWIIALLLGGSQPPEFSLVWLVAVFASILVHEMGHALVQRACGGEPRIVLYGLGGYAAATGVRENWWKNILIALAGPGAGFALAACVWLGLSRLGAPEGELGAYFFASLVFINLVWGLVNLAPIWPLDGGHVSRELLTRFFNPSTGIRASFVLSMLCAVAVGVWLFSWTRSLWNLMLFGFLAYQNYQAYEAYRASRYAR